MKKFASILFVVLCALTILTTDVSILAKDSTGHNKDIEAVLFGDEHYASHLASAHDHRTANKKISKRITLIEDAVYLSMDQMAQQGKNQLRALRRGRIPGLPLSVDDFTVPISNHRSYTHRGWDHIYQNDTGHWGDIRRYILLNTVTKEMNFKDPGIGDRNTNYDKYDKKCRSFCRLLYNIHILGDHENDLTVKDWSKKTNEFKLDIGGRHDEIDVIHQVLDDMRILFPDQLGSQHYSTIETSLLKWNDEISELLYTDGGLIDEEKRDEYDLYAVEILKLLKENMPEMFKKEAYFRDVFYTAD